MDPEKVVSGNQPLGEKGSYLVAEDLDARATPPPVIAQKMDRDKRSRFAVKRELAGDTPGRPATSLAPDGAARRQPRHLRSTGC